jgi:hypothetical protein
MSETTSTNELFASYSFGVLVKGDTIHEKLPGVESLSLASRDFTSYDECVISCKNVMDDMLARLNARGQSYKMASEINPAFTGQPTLSKDWSSGEISRLWIFEKSAEKAVSIEAVGQARIYGSSITQPRSVN